MCLEHPITQPGFYSCRKTKKERWQSGWRIHRISCSGVKAAKAICSFQKQYGWVLIWQSFLPNIKEMLQLYPSVFVYTLLESEKCLPNSWNPRFKRWRGDQETSLHSVFLSLVKYTQNDSPERRKQWGPSEVQEQPQHSCHYPAAACVPGFWSINTCWREVNDQNTWWGMGPLKSSFAICGFLWLSSLFSLEVSLIAFYSNSR